MSPDGLPIPRTPAQKSRVGWSSHHAGVGIQVSKLLREKGFRLEHVPFGPKQPELSEASDEIGGNWRPGASLPGIDDRIVDSFPRKQNASCSIPGTTNIHP